MGEKGRQRRAGGHGHDATRIQDFRPVCCAPWTQHHEHSAEYSTAGRERLIAEEREDAEGLIERIAVKTGAHARRRAELGTPHKRIVELCHEETAAFVVLGSRGRGGLKASVLGSTSMYVASNAPCPCVIVPHSVEQLPA
jgi:nucleotide-binding universal stress UspA family protein